MLCYLIPGLVGNLSSTYLDAWGAAVGGGRLGIFRAYAPVGGSVGGLGGGLGRRTLRALQRASSARPRAPKP